MSHFLVSYDLRKRRDYPELWNALNELDAFKVLDSAYLVTLSGSNTSRDLLGHLKGHVDDDDGLFVVEFSEQPAALKCKPGTKAWLEAHYG